MMIIIIIVMMRIITLALLAAVKMEKARTRAAFPTQCFQALLSPINARGNIVGILNIRTGINGVMALCNTVIKNYLYDASLDNCDSGTQCVQWFDFNSPKT